MTERFGALLCLLLLCGPSCTGTETDNPVIDFERSGCNGDGGSALRLPGVMATRAALAVGSSDYAGLYCFAWEANGEGRLRVDVFNMVGGCHIDWELAESRLDGGGLTLRVRNGECAVAGCGSCIYDLSFEVQGIDASAPLPLSLEQLDCDEEPSRDATTLMLPIDERREGVLCREGGWPAFQIDCDRPHFPPCAQRSRTMRCANEGAACGGSSVCTARPDEAYDLCLTACESDDDCSLPVEACTAGACRLRETF